MKMSFNFLKIAFLGPQGTNSHLAMNEIFGEKITPFPLKNIHSIFHQVESGEADFGVVPIENSTEGAVTYTFDELIDTSLVIVAEKFIKISCCFLSKSSDFFKIKRIYSHPQPIAQCKNWLQANFKETEIIFSESTSKAAEIVSKDSKAAAIASDLAAKIYGLNILAENIEDYENNYTRFFAIGKEKDKQKPSGHDKTSIVCSVKDKPSALLKLLKPFDETQINMTKIESRPNKKKNWEYNFFIDFLGHQDDQIVKKALQEMQTEALFLKVLGSYPRG